MDETELARKQAKVIVALRTADGLAALILQRHAEMKERKAKLQSLYKFTPNRRDRNAIEMVMKKVKLAQDQIGVMKKSRAVVGHKVETTLTRYREKAGRAAIMQLVDQTNKSLDLYNKAAAHHLAMLEKIIAEADKILESR